MHKGYKKRKGLCLVEVSTGHVRIRTRVQEWTCVHNLTCLVETSTGHKPQPIKRRYNSMMDLSKFISNKKILSKILI